MTFRGRVREAIGMPPILLVVEVFLALAILRNLNMFGIEAFIIDYDAGIFLKPFVLIVTTVISSVFAVLTMFGLPSSNRFSWRASVRTIIFLILSNILYEYLGETYLNVLSLQDVLLFSAACLVIMFLPAIREYYVPPLKDMPPLKWWLMFCLIRPDDRHNRYEFVERAED
ncbi:hypothetical protein AUP07_0902 [methanogenic archaeon mixed culture ISO4-G1]|nr:hypothetical protein AUP07_0902 [methanogenic archaeon mixed culture ISO4-G1]